LDASGSPVSAKDFDVSHAAFIIGGSLGLGQNVMERVKRRISLSPMTFPHQLARIITLSHIFNLYK